MRSPAVQIAIMVCLVLSLMGAAYSQGVKPVILLYSSTDPGFAKMLKEKIDADNRIDADVQVVLSSDILTLGTVLPQTQCIVIYAANKAEIQGLEQPLKSFFTDGGGLIGMKEPCYIPSAGELAKDVFPTFSNVSILSNPRSRVRTYVADGRSDISSGVPDSFQLPAMGIYLCADKKKTYLPNCEKKFPQGTTVLYRDQETGSPLVVAYNNENGGRSVAYAGVSVVSSPRVDIYYGKLVDNENFTKLFLNSLEWVSGSSRFRRMTSNLSQTLQMAQEDKQRLREEAVRASRQRANRRTILLAVAWTLGLASCAVIVKKTILVPPEE